MRTAAVGVVLSILAIAGCAGSAPGPAPVTAAPPPAAAKPAAPDPRIAEATRACDEAQERVKAQRFDEAAPLYEKAIGLFEAALGKEHPDVAKALVGLAGVRRLQERFGEAEPLLLRALTIQEKALSAGSRRGAARRRRRERRRHHHRNGC